MATKDMEKLIAHAKGEGFVYQGSEIYDGLANTWDYGPMGVQLKNNIKNLMVEEIRSGMSLQRRY